MFTQIGLCLMLIALTYVNVVNTVPLSSTNMEQQQQAKRLTSAFFGKFPVDPTYLLENHPYYYNDNINTDVFFHKRQLSKKWGNLFQRSQSPYTIAFPALIRTRR